jgi:ubiquinone/menaquinone biosynthesis C-methylase UbiE
MSQATQDPQIEQELEFIAKQLSKPSGDFAHKIADEMDTVNKPLYELTVQTMKPTDGENILEIGFGSGSFFRLLLSQAKGLKVRGIDHSEEMVERAGENNQDAIALGLLSLHQGNSNQLPFENSMFDKVFCNMVLYFWQDPAEHLLEIWRVLKPGGKFYTGFRPKEIMIQFPFVQYGFKLYSPDEWKVILEKQGFTVLDVSHKFDPVIEVEGETHQLESVCVVAEKAATSGASVTHS